MTIINDHKPLINEYFGSFFIVCVSYCYVICVLRVYERYLQALSRGRGGDGGGL